VNLVKRNNAAARMKYLFGPVNSRRLGISLGVDLMPCKTLLARLRLLRMRPDHRRDVRTANMFHGRKVIAELDRFLCDSPGSTL